MMCPRCDRLHCKRCDHTDVKVPRNYGRIMRNETRQWCMCCGLLWDPEAQDVTGGRCDVLGTTKQITG
jgi:hypothetical protein